MRVSILIENNKILSTNYFACQFFWKKNNDFQQKFGFKLLHHSIIIQICSKRESNSNVLIYGNLLLFFFNENQIYVYSIYVMFVYYLFFASLFLKIEYSDIRLFFFCFYKEFFVSTFLYLNPTTLQWSHLEQITHLEIKYLKLFPKWFLCSNQEVFLLRILRHRRIRRRPFTLTVRT